MKTEEIFSQSDSPLPLTSSSRWRYRRQKEDCFDFKTKISFWFSRFPSTKPAPMIIKSAQTVGRIIASRLLPKSRLIPQPAHNLTLCFTVSSHRCNSYYSRRINESSSADEHPQQQTTPSFENEEQDQFRLSIDTGKLYDEHIRLSLGQRAALSIGSAFMALADPYRDGKRMKRSPRMF